MLCIKAEGQTDVGLRRSSNEDAFRIESEKGFLVVADGMGGANAGEVASRIFVETAAEVFKVSHGLPESEIAACVQEVFRLANERILGRGLEQAAQRGMGCTAELLAFSEDGYILGHVGDSRTYLFRQGRLRQITQDHSLVQDQINRGLLTPEEARMHSLRNVILRAVGTKETLAVDLIRGKIRPGDLFLLCSDGLTSMVDDHVIEGTLSFAANLSDKVGRLIATAKDAGGHDNITVVLCEVAPV